MEHHPQAAAKTQTHHPNYLAVYITLTAITLLITGVELYMNFLSSIPREVIYAFFLVMSFIKATLVAMYYMHLKFDSRIYSVLVGLPVAFAVILVGILLIF
jgi:cytochrome c oxidase subunit 4